MKITKVCTQGRQDAGQWVTSFYLSSSVDNVHWSIYRFRSGNKVRNVPCRYFISRKKNIYQNTSFKERFFASLYYCNKQKMVKKWWRQQSHCWAPAQGTKHRIDWDSATCITYSTDRTINDSLWKAGLLTLNQRFRIVFNSYWHGTNDLLAESSKTNYERTTGQLTSLTDHIE